VKYPLNRYAGQTIILRFLSDGFYGSGVAIDDVLIVAENGTTDIIDIWTLDDDVFPAGWSRSQQPSSLGWLLGNYTDVSSYYFNILPPLSGDAVVFASNDDLCGVGCDSSLDYLLPPALTISYDSSTVDCYFQYDFFFTGDGIQRCFLEASTDNITFNLVADLHGYSAETEWNTLTHNLVDFNGNTVQMRFHDDDEGQNSGYGCAIKNTIYYCFTRGTSYIPVTTRPITSGAITSFSLTSQALTTKPLTTLPLTTNPLTSGAVTSGGLSTSPLTTNSPPQSTSGSLTTKSVTSQSVSTSPFTTQRLTTQRAITSGKAGTTAKSAVSGANGLKYSAFFSMFCAFFALLSIIN
jgi:hypothetical protein